MLDSSNWKSEHYDIFKATPRMLDKFMKGLEDMHEKNTFIDIGLSIQPPEVLKSISPNVLCLSFKTRTLDERKLESSFKYNAAMPEDPTIPNAGLALHLGFFVDMVKEYVKPDLDPAETLYRYILMVRNADVVMPGQINLLRTFDEVVPKMHDSFVRMLLRKDDDFAIFANVVDECRIRLSEEIKKQNQPA